MAKRPRSSRLKSGDLVEMNAGWNFRPEPRVDASPVKFTQDSFLSRARGEKLTALVVRVTHETLPLWERACDQAWFLVRGRLVWTFVRDSDWTGGHIAVFAC